MVAGEGASAVIGKSVEIRGEVKGSEDLLVDGHVEGTITLTESRLTVGSHASVVANVIARDVIVLGRLDGNIRASGRVELRKGCDLVGDVTASRLSVEENAQFRGKVELLQAAEKGEGKAPEKTAAAASSSATPAKGAEAPLFNPSSRK